MLNNDGEEFDKDFQSPLSFIVKRDTLYCLDENRNLISFNFADINKVNFESVSCNVGGYLRKKSSMQYGHSMSIDDTNSLNSLVLFK